MVFEILLIIVVLKMIKIILIIVSISIMVDKLSIKKILLVRMNFKLENWNVIIISKIDIIKR